jgi:hypothetical protein
MVSAPGHAHLLAIKFQYTLTDFLLRDSLYPDTAPVPSPTFVTGDEFVAPIKLVPGSRQHVIKFVPGLQKHVPYPPFPASETMYPDSGILPSDRDASGNTTSPYCRAVIFKPSCDLIDSNLDFDGLNITQ